LSGFYVKLIRLELCGGLTPLPYECCGVTAREGALRVEYRGPDLQHQPEIV
jgi:hypothetical protein